ncbi:MAG: hypothetical protein ACOYET_07525 [Bacillota bacterium]|jgi:hypothetical protein
MIFVEGPFRRKRTDVVTGQSVIADPAGPGQKADPVKPDKEKKQDPKPDSLVRVKKTEI